jgi:hypothetical protein
MARLIPQGQGGLTEPFELRLGVNRIGRGPHNDFSIDHATISALHCELVLDGDGLSVRDLGSTNGTFINGQPVRTGPLLAGQYLRLGSVELLVEFSAAQVIIPQFRPEVAPPVMRAPTGESVCLHHQTRQAVWKCSRCGHLLCTPCIHRLRRRGGKVLYLCPDCSGICEVLPEFAKQSKRSWFGFVRDKLDVTKLLSSRRKRKAGP